MPETLQTAMANPSFYGPDVKHVTIIQTHISTVALTGTYAYKVKKPVNFGFLDFSTLDKRKHYCEEELRLNRRLCPDIYLDIIPITQHDDTYQLNGDGPTVDYAVKMKEFPQHQIMTHQLKEGNITTQHIDRLVDRLVQFYNADTPTQEVQQQGRPAAVKQNIDENFQQTADLINTTIPADTYDYIRTANDHFFELNPDIFTQRIHQGYIHDCHGDLHSGNIVISDAGLCVFDCIEFNTRFRYCDVASDIAFLAMDLDYHNQPYLASHLIRRYVDQSGDHDVYTVLNFYKSYRAYVRGKVLGFRLNDPHTPPSEKHTIITTAQRYFQLSKYYASLFTLDIDCTQPLMFLVTGLTGTGKSTIAEKLAVDYGTHLLNTDVIRKELAGIDPFERHHESLDTGLYSLENVDKTYKKMVDLAWAIMGRGDRVVLDATFQKETYRTIATTAAEGTHAILTVIHCETPDQIVKQRLDQRLKEKTISDGRWEIYQAQKKTFEPFKNPQGIHLDLDTGNETYDYRIHTYQNLSDMIHEAV
jgi:aminoglycoside phosphotransferase family enzyme/predicted kinase